MFTVLLVVQAGHRSYPTNWDALAYAVLAEEAAGASFEASWLRAYAGLNEADPTSAALRRESAYRQTVATDSGAFRQQLPFYRSRVLYVEAAGTLVRLGVAPYRALAVLNALAVAALAVLLLLMLQRTVGVAAGTLAVLLLFVTGVQGTAALFTPDVLVAALVVAGGLAIYQRRLMLAAVAFGLAALARPDALLIGAILLTLPMVNGQGQRWRWIGAAGAVALLGVLAQVLTGGYGWATVFHHTFIAHLVHPADILVSVGAGDYVDALVRGLRYALGSGGALVITEVGTVAVVLLTNERAVRLLALAVGGAALLHLVLFPAGLARFYVGHALLTGILLVEAGRSGRIPRTDRMKPAHA